MDGLISFFSSFHAVRAETVLKGGGFSTRLVPGPKELTPNCGVALRFDYDERDRVLVVLAEAHVRIEAVHAYRPRTDDWAGRGGTPAAKVRQRP